MKFIKLNCRIMAVAIMIMTSFASCSKDNTSTDNNTPAAVTGVKLSSSANFGNIITDNNGRALYFFSIDANGSSGCADGCAVVWPVFYKENPSIGTGLAATDFGVITRADGSKQTTYKGWPLYYYQNDAKAGDVNGDKVGNTWFVAKADYTVMLANAQLVGHLGVQYNSQLQPGQGITQFITDAAGRTLYAFSPDKFNKNTFTRADFSNNAVWPIYETATVMSIPSILDKTQFAIIDVFGKKQLTYKGWPLYYFGNDLMVRGSTKGVSFPAPGVWPITNTTTVTASVQ
ncbi:hypothetical protein [Mucilaginibacter terrae]|uniref:Lipoprotein with Yx(FWY)xxD motif n=1 Tax=Mucilaginibacter terrae TaxID=1955052 RepID=A0ABU3GVH3_9SPHI|nr:hypothetical protein [Mucilaginibacter terrae]MDT3403660.1 putative lipoprotein with Yx(FWY)xxD motif [Mucilaginibacter terrae]